jgi:membrane protein implicated in regulation of membrane protease activity
MTGVYLFAAAVGLPLVVWFLVAGIDDGAEGGDAEGLAGVMFRLLPLSSLAIAASGFGVTGLALTAVDTSSGVTLVAALVVALFAAVANSALYSFLRRSESTSDVSDADLSGSIGRVVLPVSGAHRGRIALTRGDQPVYLSAEGLPGAAELEAGAPVLVVEVRNGIARVARLDAELE